MPKGPKPTPWLERFNAKIKRGDGCWEWLGGKICGYGVFNTNRPDRKSIRAHRLSYEISCGEIPDGINVLHKCDNPSCVRPDHLFLGTQADNLRDMAVKGRSGRKKLLAEDVYAILWRSASGEFSKKIAAEYGVNPTTVSRIVCREMWPSLSQSHD